MTYAKHPGSKPASAESLINTWTGRLKAEHPAAMAHAQRVASTSFDIAGQLGLDAATCRDAYCAGLLHSVGRLRLSASELEGEHADADIAMLGASLVVKCRPLRRVAHAILLHGERLDGSGVPIGKHGDGIPELARIVAVADVFDALTQDHPSGPVLGAACAVETLLSEAGRRFDARVVHALAACWTGTFVAAS
jgi:HD-GYP domain-containing protein (c-di-GMP phosphodiesterase class II)